MANLFSQTEQKAAVAAGTATAVTTVSQELDVDKHITNLADDVFEGDRNAARWAAAARFVALAVVAGYAMTQMGGYESMLALAAGMASLSMAIQVLIQ